jgi:hypothetical protein
MTMNYLYLTGYPQNFLRMTGLHIDEVDALVHDVQALYYAAEIERLSRPDRQRAIGGGDHPDLSMRDQVLLTVIGLRHFRRRMC